METMVIDQSLQWVVLIGDMQLTMSNIISILALFSTLLGLVFVAWQLRQIARQNEFSVLQARYKLILDVQKFCFENPEHIQLWVGGTRYKNINESSLTLEEQKDLIGKDIIMDTLEYFFLSGNFSSKEHEKDFLRRLLGNPRVCEYLKSPLRGSFRKEFETIIGEILHEQTDEVISEQSTQGH